MPQSGHAGRINALVLSADEKLLITTGAEGSIKYWDTRSGKEVRSSAGELNSGMGDCELMPALDAQERTLYTSQRYGNIQMWDVASGASKGTLPIQGSLMIAANDRKHLAVANNNEVQIVDLQSKKVVAKLAPPIGLKADASLDTHAGDCARGEGDCSRLSELAFSADGRRLGVATSGVTRVWTWAGSALPTTLAGVRTAVRLAFSPDGSMLAAADYTGGIGVWNATTGARLVQLVPSAKDPKDYGVVAFTPDGKGLIVSQGHLLRIYAVGSWKVQNERQIFSASEQAKTIYRMVLAPRSNMVIASDWRRGDIRWFHLPDLEEARSISNRFGSVTSLSFAPVGRRLLVASAPRDWVYDGGSPANVFAVWNLDSMRVEQSFQARSAEFSADGNSVRYRIGADSVLLDLATGRTERGKEAPAAPAPPVDVDRLVREQRAVTDACYARKWWFEDARVATDPAKQLFAAIGNNQKVGKVANDKTGEESTFLGHTTITRAIALSADGRLVAIGGTDGTTRVWPIVKGDVGGERSVVLLHTPSDWLAYTEDGYFDASNNGSGLIGVASGLTAFAVDQFAMRNNRPDVLIERLGGDRDIQRHFKERYLKRLLRAGVAEADLQAGLHVPTASIAAANVSAELATLTIKLADSRVPLKRYNVYVNDVPLFGADGKPLSGKAATVTERVELTRGPNKIEVSCFNSAGAESYRALTMATSTRPEVPDLYYLGFGVSSYENAALNLQFADKDARDLAGAFGQMGAKFSHIYSKTWTNEQVTPAAITAAKDVLRDAKPWDVVVLFIAGHGMHAEDAEARYYYLTYGAKPDALAQTAAPFEAMESLLQGISPRKKLFLMDTCESGERDDSAEQKSTTLASAAGIRPRAVRGVRIKTDAQAKPRGRSFLLHGERFIYNDLIRRSGAIVFSSSRGAEYSFESEAIKNGFFTSEILAAWRDPSADVDKDGSLSTDELRTFVSTRVAEKTKEQQHPTVDRDNLSQKLMFPAAHSK